jgi:hypothetical protein
VKAPKILLAVAAFAAAWPASAESLDPLTFFSGRTRGEGKLKVALKAPVTVNVDTRGTPDGRGGIVLDQIVREGAKPPRSNRWMLHPTSSTTFSGTLTEAAGPVRGSMAGRVLKFRYTRKDGMRASHVLTLQPDGRTMTNRMTIKRLGIIVARVEEVIRKLD